MNIHSLKSQGSGVSLGPVTVAKAYPRNPGAKYSFYLISDGTDKEALKVWGKDLSIQEGQNIILTGFGPKGGLKTSEYNGKTSIDANDCSLTIVDGAQTASQPAQEAAYQAPAQHAPSSQQAPSSGSHRAKMESVAKSAATVTALYIDELVVNHGFSKDEAIMLSQNASGIFPLWWFGEKGIS